MPVTHITVLQVVRIPYTSVVTKHNELPDSYMLFRFSMCVWLQIVDTGMVLGMALSTETHHEGLDRAIPYPEYPYQ